MALEMWCGKECCECTSPCALDMSIPCSPDCENLNADGSRKVKKCKASGCDAYEK